MNRRRFLEFASAAAAATVLAACGSSEKDDRRFANQPMPTEDLAGHGVTPANLATKPTAAAGTEISRASLFQIHGNVTRIVCAAEREYWSVRSDGSDLIRFGKIPSAATPAVAATPDGKQIALLVDAADGGETMAITDERGAEQRRLSISPPTAKANSAPASRRPPRGRIAWNASGDQVLYAQATGGIVSVGASGDPIRLISSKQAPDPGSVAWSPSGNAITFVNRAKPSASDGLFVGATDSAPIDPAGLIAASSSHPRAISQVAWLQDGARILFSQRSQDANAALSGDLFQVAASGGVPKLLISAGVAGPVSAIGIFAVSPGEEAIAATVLVPSGAGTAFHSLWLMQLDGATNARLEVPSNSAVTQLWWTDQGLVWREEIGTLDPDRVSAAFTLRRLGANGTPVEVFSPTAIPPTTPVASPVFSPVAATPRAGATP